MAMLDETIALLEAHKGDQEGAVAALRAYVAEHRLLVRRLVVDGRAIVAKMSPKDRKAFEKLATKQRMERVTKLENLARTFKDPKLILVLAHLVVN